jgi:hypothetical protein
MYAYFVCVYIHVAWICKNLQFVGQDNDNLASSICFGRIVNTPWTLKDNFGTVVPLRKTV